MSKTLKEKERIPQMYIDEMNKPKIFENAGRQNY